jgi:hypothetical protein
MREPLIATTAFDYSAAFDRNIGWVTTAEQATLRRKRVAIAGVGGVGGVHLLTLARLGVAHFRIADLDTFELANFNRQAGAMMSTLDRPKVDVLSEMARDINPECQIDIFQEGVHPDNLDAFLADTDLYMDGLDAFAFDAREAVFAGCARRRIPATTAAPLGLSAVFMNFLPGGMTFEEYFRLEGCSALEKAVRFLVGLAPSLLHRTYVAEASRIDLRRGRGPSNIIACQLCAGVAAGEALKILLGRGEVRSAPHAYQFDAYRNRLAHTWRPGGNRHPLNRAAIAFAKYRLGIQP